KEAIEIFKLINISTEQVRRLVDGLESYTFVDKLISEKKELTGVSSLIKSVVKIVDHAGAHNIRITGSLDKIEVNKPALKHILTNLISNAIKYNDKDHVFIEVGYNKTDEFYHFYVTDNGVGIEKENHKKIFNMFEVFKSHDRNGFRGVGVGLSIVKKLITELGGQIEVRSELGFGSVFTFSIAR
ncbi:MAG: hypothetical protein HYZ42_07950, partial [Bacteroidetes bacterium]|nr:hypothetical protein [Bacteroidota bacterium]